MTGNHDNVIALMCAAMLGYGTARFISNGPLYHALSRAFIVEAIRRRRTEVLKRPAPSLEAEFEFRETGSNCSESEAHGATSGCWHSVFDLSA